MAAVASSTPKVGEKRKLADEDEDEDSSSEQNSWEEEEVEEAPMLKDRVKGKMYMFNGEKRCWNGAQWYCEHRTFKSICKHCHGSGRCEHGARRYFCTKCGGGGVCLHGRRRGNCKECNGSNICIHQKLRTKCKECHGSSFCVHGKRKEYCRDCPEYGSGYCCHGKLKRVCHECDGGDLCSKCRFTHINGIRHKYGGLCARCWHEQNPSTNTPPPFKTRENEVYLVLRDWLSAQNKMHGTTYDIVRDKRIEGGCSKRRPDFFIDCATHAIMVENDEDQHKKNGNSCDAKRDQEVWNDLGCQVLIVVRFNPDRYIDSNGRPHEGCFKYDHLHVLKKNEPEFKRRIDALLKVIEAVTNPVKPPSENAVRYLFYDGCEL